MEAVCVAVRSWDLGAVMGLLWGRSCPQCHTAESEASVILMTAFSTSSMSAALACGINQQKGVMAVLLSSRAGPGLPSQLVSTLSVSSRAGSGLSSRLVPVLPVSTRAGSGSPSRLVPAFWISSQNCVLPWAWHRREKLSPQKCSLSHPRGPFLPADVCS